MEVMEGITLASWKVSLVASGSCHVDDAMHIGGYQGTLRIALLKFFCPLCQSAFSAFPDSNAFESVGETAFSFRTKASAATYAALGPGHCDADERNVDDPDEANSTERFLYGYVFFRQQKDERIRRGFFQVRSFGWRCGST